MSKNQEPQQVSASECIAEFLNFMRYASQHYSMSFDDVGEADKELCDLEHSLELGEHTYHEYAQLAKQIREVRQKRRRAKDMTQVSVSY